MTDITRHSGPLVVVMGPAGCGKSTVGAALAQRLYVPFHDADDLHPTENTEKMRRGIPLSDEDRWPWLRAVGMRIQERRSAGAVMACSALRRSHREVILEEAPGAFFVQLQADKTLLASRMATRDHFMPLALLDSQLATLEDLAPSEPGVIVSAAWRLDRIVAVGQDAVQASRTVRA